MWRPFKRKEDDVVDKVFVCLFRGHNPSTLQGTNSIFGLIKKKIYYYVFHMHYFTILKDIEEKL
jgi:hypothetical protein